MTALGTVALGTRPLAGSLVLGPPIITVTAPKGVVSTANPTITWTYLSPIGRAQVGYLILIQDAWSNTVFSQSFAGAAVSHPLTEFDLSPNQNYRIFVRAYDMLPLGGADPRFSGSDATTVTTDDFPPDFGLADVGSLYEIGINGVGLMLADSPNLRVQRQTQQLEPERLVTTDTPFTESLDRYSNIGFNDWSRGEGQLMRDHEFSEVNRYWQSINIDPFAVRGELSLSPATEQWISDTYTNQLAVVASHSVYVLTGDNELTARDTYDAGTNTAFSVMASGTIVDLATDGEFWYATNGTEVRQGSTPATPAGNWSTADVTEIEWIGDRIAGIDGPNGEFVHFSSGGAETVLFTHTGKSLRAICGGDGFAWYGVNSVGSDFTFTDGEVWYWKVDSSPTVRGIGLVLPYGETVDELFFYLGNVFMSTANVVSQKRKIYRCVPSEGILTPELIVELDNSTFRNRVRFAAEGKYIAFSWEHAVEEQFDTMQQVAAIGVFDLETSGYCRYVAIGPQGGFFSPHIGGLVSWRGHFGATLDGQGFYGRKADEEYQDWGILLTSVSDLGSTTKKTLDKVGIQYQSLNGTVTVERSNSLNFSHDAVGTVSTLGSVGTEFPQNSTSRSWGFKIRLDAGTDNEFTPRFQLLQAKIHPIGEVDDLIVFPVNCANELRGVLGPMIANGEQGAGMKRLRWLKSLVSTQVQLQDVDWPITRTTDVYQLIKVEAVTDGTPDVQAGWRTDSGIALVTLRRPQS